MTNRQKLEKAATLINEVAADRTLGPSPYQLLLDAERAVAEAARWTLDVHERSTAKFVRETDRRFMRETDRRGH